MSQFERPASDEAATGPDEAGAGDPGAEGTGDPGVPVEGPPAEDGPGDGDAPAPVARLSRRERRERERGAGSFLRELPVLLLIAFVLAFLLRTFVVQVFYIPSSSMEPTLEINDRMVVEKITYRFTDPERGDIAVFEGEELGAVPGGQNGLQRVIRGVGQFIGIVPASARDFVKRVIGLPGDEIVIEDGVVFVNGEALDEPYVVYDDTSNYGPVTVPEGHLFFLGDNRPNSSDSRRSLGFVPSEQLVGRAAVVIWPLDHVGLLTGATHEVPERGPAPAPDEPEPPGEADDEPGPGDPDGATPDEEAGAGREEDGASAPRDEPQPLF